MTVAESKARMTYAEARRWGAFFSKRGAPGMQSGLIPEIQRGFAMLAAITINSNGGYKGGRRAKIEDFMPKREGEDQQATAQDAFSLLASLSKKRDDPPRKKRWRRKKG